ncbi:MAG TPA: YitT family protein [Firmicutes bacterium]|nr:YitT family protein [Bacillota bacterium]
MKRKIAEGWRRTLMEYGILTGATVILNVGIYFFKFPNNFTFGGVSGLSVLVSAKTPLSAGTVNLLVNAVLLVLGFIFLGRDFGIKTVYVTVLNSLSLRVMEMICPMTQPLTDQPLLELIFATLLPAVSAALLFNIGASSGGTDIVAMILKKHSQINIGTALLLVDMTITVAAFFIFDMATGLYSVLGLLLKSLVIDNVIESINMCKYFTIVCDNPDPICDFIHEKLHRGATVYKAEGSYRHTQKTVILTVMKRSQAVQLRNFVHIQEPMAFITITNSSEIIGKGFRGFS